MFEIRSSEICIKEGGYGVFAVRDIPLGTLVMRENPLLELNHEEVEREVSRLQNIKLKRHDKMQQKNSQLIAKKVVKISFVCEKFSLLKEEDKSLFLSFSDAFNYFANKEESRLSLDIESIEVLSVKHCFPFSPGVAAKVCRGEYTSTE